PTGQRGGPGTTSAGAPTAPPNQTGGRAGFSAPVPGQTTGGVGGQTAPGGISGVTSKSKAQSIRLYNGRGHYNEWAFVYIQQQQAAGAGGAPGSGTPGRGGQRGQQPGQPPGPFPGGNQPGQRGRG